MRKLLLTALLSLCTVALAASTASAFPLSTSAGPITATSSAVQFQGPINISCNVTLNGSINGSIAASGSTAGSITSGSLSSCTAPAGLQGFSWTLSAVTLLTDSGGRLIGVLGNLSRVSFFVTVLGIRCTYSGTIPVLVGQPTGSPAYNAITVLSNTLTGSPAFPCATGRIATGTVFRSTPAKTITRP